MSHQPDQGQHRRWWARWGWRRLLLGLVVLVVAVFALLQAIPYGRDHTNPPVVTGASWDSPVTEQLFTAACADCHSNLTEWPWYTNVAPFSWLAQHDVDEGRASFNLSELDRRGLELEEIAEVIREGEMPPWQYALLHGDARLSDDQKEQLINGLRSTLAGTPARTGDQPVTSEP